jgi:hypothetical protein
MSSDKLISALSTIRCGYPCSYVLKVTNELQLDMIKVQHWGNEENPIGIPTLLGHGSTYIRGIIV